MKAIIIGAGQVGRTVATKLSEEHRITVVDRDSQVLETIPYELEAVHGNAAELETLKRAGIEKADLLIASTSDDPTNILICNTAKVLGDPFTIARVNKSSYLESWEYSPSAFGVDLMVSRADMTAETIVEVVGFQSSRESARDISYFAGGKIQMAEFDVLENSCIAGKTVAEADQFEGLTFGALFREGDIEFPGGSSRIEPGDRIVVIGPNESVQSFGMDINPEKERGPLNDIVIFGGGEIGSETARKLERRNIQPRVVEWDEKRARYLAETLPESLVLQEDARSRDFWEQEGFGQADMAIIALRPDERSLLVSGLAGICECKRIVSVVHEQEYLPVFEESEIDVVVHPREKVAEKIIRYIEESYAEKIESIEHHRGEVFEVEVGPDSLLLDGRLEDVVKELPEGVVIGAIVRENDVIMPRGNTKIRSGDRLVVLADSEIAEEVAKQI